MKPFPVLFCFLALVLGLVTVWEKGTAQTREYHFEHHFKTDSTAGDWNCTYRFETDSSIVGNRSWFSCRVHCNNFIYPKAASQNNIQGRVIVQLSVSQNWELLTVEVVKGLGYGLDEIAAGLVQALGEDLKKQKLDFGQMVFTFPITFSLE